MKKLIVLVVFLIGMMVTVMAQNEGPQGIINGKFSVSADKQVYFAQGNLQYQATTNTYRFAEAQTSIRDKDNQNMSPDYDGWIDLFAWGTGYNPAAVNSYNLCVGGEYVELGKNDISNSNVKNWYTLTSDEWKYVFKNRDTSSGIRYAKAMVNNVTGMILLPDNWDPSVFELKNINSDDAVYKGNIISNTDWIDKLEANGAVFLPAAGIRNPNVGGVGRYGYYWSSTGDYVHAGCVTFSDSRVFPDGGDNRGSGCSVRLACDAASIQYKDSSEAGRIQVAPKSTVNGKFSVSPDKQVCFSKGNLQYQESTGTWRFAQKQWHKARITNYSRDNSRWVDLFGWGTGNNPIVKTQNYDYSEFSDWGNNTISNGEDKEWFTLTQEEWDYLFNVRTTTSGIRYAKAQVYGVSGVILLPDDWDPSIYELKNVNKPDTFVNTMSDYLFETVLEPHGAVFLPSAGSMGTSGSIDDSNNAAYYWSVTGCEDNVKAMSLHFAVAGVETAFPFNRKWGCSVRLVCLPE